MGFAIGRGRGRHGRLDANLSRFQKALRQPAVRRSNPSHPAAESDSGSACPKHKVNLFVKSGVVRSGGKIRTQRDPHCLPLAVARFWRARSPSLEGCVLGPAPLKATPRSSFSSGREVARGRAR